MTPTDTLTSPRRIRKQLLRDAQDHKQHQLNLDVQDQLEMRYHWISDTLKAQFPEMSVFKVDEVANERACLNRKDRRRAGLVPPKQRMKRAPR